MFKIVSFGNRCFTSSSCALIKNIFCAEGEREHSIIIRLFKKFRSNFKNFDSQTMPRRPKSVHSEAVLEAIDID